RYRPRQMLRALTVLAVSCAILAPSAAAVEVSSSAVSATITWRTDTATRGRVVYGVDGLYLYSVPEAVATTAHAVTLGDLTPSITYRVKVGAVAGELTTDALPADVRFGVEGTHVTANDSL